jgi:hypothetical protein
VIHGPVTRQLRRAAAELKGAQDDAVFCQCPYHRDPDDVCQWEPTLFQLRQALEQAEYLWLYECDEPRWWRRGALRFEAKPSEIPADCLESGETVPVHPVTCRPLANAYTL